MRAERVYIGLDDDDGVGRGIIVIMAKRGGGSGDEEGSRTLPDLDGLNSEEVSHRVDRRSPRLGKVWALIDQG